MEIGNITSTNPYNFTITLPEGLGDLVWVLVALSLLAVSAVSSYIGNRKTLRESRFTSFAESLWIHPADILNNSVACGKTVAAPLRYTRAWWLLGVVIIIQFWCAGLKSNLLVDDSLLIDSLEDVMSKTKIICYMTPSKRLIQLLEGEDLKNKILRPQLRRNGQVLWDYDNNGVETFASGKAVVVDQGTAHQQHALFEKLKRNNRKLYVGKTKYEEFYIHMFFNKRLPRDIKERIDYVSPRVIETRQLEPLARKGKYNKQRNLFDSNNSTTSMSFTPMDIVYLNVIFRLWIIGLSFSTATFFFECFGTEWGEKCPY